MRPRAIGLAGGLALLCICPTAQARRGVNAWFWRNAPTRQGSASPGLHSVPGNLHVPTAQSLPSGEFWFAWSNYAERSDGARHAHNFHLAAGLLPGLTMAARISGKNYNTNDSSDLSLHLHWKVPLIPRRWFDLALGVQDFGGAVTYYRGYYAVVSRAFSTLQLTLGWGLGNDFTPRTQGFLAALSWHPLSFLSVSAEWDGHAVNTAARLDSPARWFNGRLSLGAVAAVTGVARLPKLYALGYLKMSLASSPPQMRQASRALRTPRGVLHRDRYPIATTPRITDSDPPTAPALPRSTLAKIYKALHAQGLERVRIASSARGLRICVDNTVFERSAIDAAGVVLGIASNALDDDRRIELSLTKHAVPLVTLSTHAQRFSRMLLGAPALPGVVKVRSGASSPCPHARRDKASPFGRPRLSLAPRVVMTAATELGYLDLQLGAMWGLSLPLAWGSSLSVAYQHGIWNSVDFVAHGPLGPFRMRPGFVEAALHQAFPIVPGLLGLFSVGLFDIDRWTSSLHLRAQRGIHTLSAFGSAFTLRFDKAYFAALGQYRVEWPGAPVALTLAGGQFPDQSTGVRSTLEFAWGDTLISAIFRYGTVKTLGIGLTLPLAPRKNRMLGQGRARLLLSSTPAYTQSLHTRVGNTHNRLVQRSWLSPGRAYGSMERIYTEQNRLTESRLAFSLQRMRDAYHRYVTGVR